MTSSLVSESISSLLSWPVGNIMNNDAIILEADRSLDEAIKRMKEKNQRSVLASHLGEVVGMVSKTDILYKVTSEGKNPSKIKLREIMVHAYSAVLGIISREDISRKMEEIALTSVDEVLHGKPVCIIDTKTIEYVKDSSKANF